MLLWEPVFIFSVKQEGQGRVSRRLLASAQCDAVCGLICIYKVFAASQALDFVLHVDDVL